METNETILTREVVVIDTHKRLGNVKALRVDCDTRAVSHYIVNNASTGSSLVLPLDKALAVGDTFMTVQSRDDFLPATDTQVENLLQNGYSLLGEEVFSLAGNRIGKVKGFEFDPVFGTVGGMTLDNQKSYASDSFIFFSPEFVFVDDGSATAAEIRSGAKPAGDAPKDTQAEPAAAPAAAAAASGAPADVDEEIEDFLVGATLTADVESEDGAFKLAKGTTLTSENIAEAEKHDALLLLTINVDV